MAPISTARLGVRALQAFCSLFAMIFTAVGYIQNTDGELSGASANFSMLVCYSALVYSMYYVLPLGVLKLSASAPKVNFQRLWDAVLVVMLLLAAILHVASTAVSDCSTKNSEYESYYGEKLFRCGNLSTAIVFTFITFALFLVTLIWSVWRDSAKSVNGEGLSDNLDGSTGQSAALAAAYADADARSPFMAILRRAGRFVQFACSLVVFICTLAGYKHFYTGRYMSTDGMFLILVSWSCMLYTIFQLVFVEILKKSHRPSVGVERFMDVLLAVLLLLGAILFTASHQVSNCASINAEFAASSALDDVEKVFRCGSMKAAYIFAFIDFVVFLVTLLVSFCAKVSTTEAHDAGERV